MKNILDFNNGKMSDKAFTQNLLISVVSILLCIGLLCSVTYAWFSKEAEVGNHIITSGNFSLDATVIYTNPETSEAVAVAVDTLSDGTMSCILEKKGTTYTVVLSMTEEANVKGYCAISIGNDVNEITVPMSREPEIGADSLSFTITTAEDNTVVCFTPKWGYPAASTLMDGASIVLNGGSTDEEHNIPEIPETPEVLDVPETPNTSETLETPVSPVVPEESGTSEIVEEPENVEIPSDSRN